MLTISNGFQLKPPPASATVSSKSTPSPASAGVMSADAASPFKVMGWAAASLNSATSFSRACAGDNPPMGTPSTAAFAAT